MNVNGLSITKKIVKIISPTTMRIQLHGCFFLFAMNLYLKYLLLAFLSFSLLTCKEKDIDLLNDGNPRIVSISFSGIPKEDISIDQENLLITVKVPSVIPENLTASIELTTNAKLRISELDWANAFWQDVKEIDIVNLADDKDYPAHLSRYQLKAIAKDTLKFENTTEPIEYVLANGNDRSFYIPAINLYGNPLPLQVKFTELHTGQTVILDSTVSTYPKPVFRGIDSHLNHLTIYVGEQRNLLPGSYSIELLMPNGLTLKVPQSVIMKQGPMNFINWPAISGPVIKRDEEMLVTGDNFFDGTINVELIDSVDQVFPVKNLEFDKYGTKMKIRIPSSTRFGRYSVRVIQKDNQAPPFCFRIKVSDKPHDPLEIFLLQEGEGYCTLNLKTMLTRGIWLTMQANYFEGKARFRMVPVSGAAKQYYAKAIIFSYFNFEGEPSIFVPENVTAGFYKVTLQSLDETGKVTGEGPPFWRLVEVK